MINGIRCRVDFNHQKRIVAQYVPKDTARALQIVLDGRIVLLLLKIYDDCEIFFQVAQFVDKFFACRLNDSDGKKYIFHAVRDKVRRLACRRFAVPTTAVLIKPST